MDACSRGAIHKRPDGIVLIDHKKCAGAADCVDACPYGVIDINPAEDYFPGQKLPYEKMADSNRMHPPGKASTCTLCVHRIDRGKEPVCVAGCTSKAMIFGDLEDPKSPIRKKLGKSRQMLAFKGTHAKVSYIAPRNLWKQIEKRIIENPKMVR
jgi:molybdopterin-containing oxidoreductase family iron-sulfur binding subunit